MEDLFSDVRPRALRNIAWTFAALTVLVLGVVAYTTLASAVIGVTLGDVSRDINFRLGLVANKLGQTSTPGSLPASFFETTDTAEGTFIPSGNGALTGKAGGSVTIHNETGRDQPLVATTRLLSTEGILFRLKSAVRVPASGTVQAIVEADKDGATAEIGPSRFTIPGLNTALQQNIYATSATPMVRGAAAEKTVTASDIETARQSLKTKLLEKARTAIVLQAPQSTLQAEDFISSVVNEKVSSKIGSKANSFTLTMTLNSVAVIFNKAEMIRAIEAQTGGVKVSPTAVKYSLVNYDAVGKSVTLTGTAKAQRAIERTSSIFNSANFVGLTPDEVQSFLLNYDGIRSVVVTVTPYWLTRLPRIPGRIRVVFE